MVFGTACLILIALGETTVDGTMERANRVLREGAVAYGDRYYDEATSLVRRTDDMYHGRLNVAQHSIEYAAALFDSGRRIARANAVVAAVLDHQWTKPGRPWETGNFIWWHDQNRVEDRNAVAFLAPWLCYVATACRDHLTEANRTRLTEALTRCVGAIKGHGGRVNYDNIWLLRTASLAALAHVLDRPALLKESERWLDRWIAQTSRDGISEFNSPCYAAVNIYALEWLLRYAPAEAKALRRKTGQVLDFLYADVFQNWHWHGGIGAGTHSRAYPRDADTGRSLVSALVFKQCGGERRTHVRSFEYVFAVNDYRVPDFIRAYAEKKGALPLWLRASHPVHDTKARVERSLYVAREVTLGTQTGRRPCREQDIGFKITYAGSKVDRRSSYIRAVPSHIGGAFRGPIRCAAHQEGPLAVVLYEADMKGLKQSAYLRLNIEPRDGGMIDEFLINGEPYTRTRRRLKAGTVLGWRVGKALVAIRLLEGRAVDPEKPDHVINKGYSLSPIKDSGLCLHCLLCYRPKARVAVNSLSCGFVVRVGSTAEFGSLAKMLDAAAEWAVTDAIDGERRDVTCRAGETQLRLLWDGARNRALRRETNGRETGPWPLYDSPLIRLKRGGPLTVTPAKE